MTRQSSKAATPAVERPTGPHRQGDPNPLLLWAVRGGVFLVLVTPLIVTADALFPFVVGKALFSRSVITATFALWLALIFLYPQYRLSKSWILLAFGLWLLVSLVTSFTGASLERSLWSNFERMQGVIDRAHWLVFTLVTVSVFRSLADWRLLFSVNLGVAGLVSALGILQRFEVLGLVIVGGEDRISSTLGNSTYLAAYATISAVIGAALLVHSFSPRAREERRQGRMRRAERRRRRRQGGQQLDLLPWLRAFWAAMILTCLVALWLTGTRGSIVGLWAGVVVFSAVYMLWGTFPRVQWAAFGILAAAFLSVSFIMAARSTDFYDPVIESSETLERLTSLGVDDRSFQGRLSTVRVGVRAYLDKPLLGWGPQNFMVAWGKHFDGEAGIREQFDLAHSKPIEELTASGTLGLVSYMLIWLGMAAVLVRAVRRREGIEQMLFLVVGAAMVAYFTQNLFLFDTAATTILFALLVGFAVSEEWRGRALDPAPAQGTVQRIRTRLASLAAVTAFAAACKGPAQKIRTSLASLASALETWGKRLEPAARWASRSLHKAWVGALALVILAVLTGSLVYLFGYRPYSAAQAMITGVDSSLPWQERRAHIEEAIEGFPALALIPRRYLMVQAGRGVPTMEDSEFLDAVELVATEGAKALESEPQNWRVHIALVEFYHIAGSRDREYLKDARRHLDAAQALAPNARFVTRAIEQQEKLEEL